jgi:hypothetical protein
VAVGITATGQREVLGIEVGDSEDEAFWTAFLRAEITMRTKSISQSLNPSTLSMVVKKSLLNHSPRMASRVPILSLPKPAQ